MNNYHNLKRFFVDDIINDEYIILSGQNFLHAKNVMRLKIKDNIIGINNDGIDYLCEISEINKDNIIAEIIEKKINQAEPKKKLDIFQALLKGDKMDYVVQKCTELGANALYPFVSEYCQIKSSTIRTDRLQKITQESAKQCKRSNSLVIGEVLDFNAMVEKLEKYDLVLFAYELEEQEKLNSQLFVGKQNIAIIIGSEGGFSIEETEKMKKDNIKTITLGKRILRAETATIHLCGLAMHYLEENK